MAILPAPIAAPARLAMVATLAVLAALAACCVMTMVGTGPALAEEEDAGAARGAGPLLSVDDMGNFHINTSEPASTAVFVNGLDIASELETLTATLSAQLSQTIDYEQSLATQTQAILSLTALHQSSLSTLRTVVPCASVSFSAGRDITNTLETARFVFAADVDGDGDNDVLGADRDNNTVLWYENLGNGGTFSDVRVISTNASSVRTVVAADFDGDGDLDVLSASSFDGKIAWYENTDGAGAFSTENVITTAASSARGAIAADLDGDGDLDVLSASANDNKIAWYRNEDGKGSFSQQRIINAFAQGARAVSAGDIDGDGDLDVVSASATDHTIAWYENTDGKGNFSPAKLISTRPYSFSVQAVDLDDDGDVDVLVTNYRTDALLWFENLDGRGTFSEQKVITDIPDYPTFALAADLDADGDMDVVSTSLRDATVAWYENTGNGTFSERRVIMDNVLGSYSAHVADINGDGDLDVLSASLGNSNLAWYENLCD